MNKLLAASKDALSRLEDWIGSDCECDNTHEANGTKCCLCELREAISEANKIPRIVITLEGGLVQTVMSDTESMEALVVDYDTDDADEDELFINPDGDKAYGHKEEVAVMPDRVEAFFMSYEDDF